MARAVRGKPKNPSAKVARHRDNNGLKHFNTTTYSFVHARRRAKICQNGTVVKDALIDMKVTDIDVDLTDIDVNAADIDMKGDNIDVEVIDIDMKGDNIDVKITDIDMNVARGDMKLTIGDVKRAIGVETENQ
jgi:hypothetical protein